MARPRRPIASVINASLTALALVGLFVVQAYFVGGAVGLLPAAHAEMPAFAAADVPDGPIMVDYCSEAVAARDPGNPSDRTSTSVELDDAWFAGDSRRYHHGIATNCAVLSAVCNAESHFYSGSGDRIPYAEQALSALGFSQVRTDSYELHSAVLDQLAALVSGSHDVAAYTFDNRRLDTARHGDAAAGDAAAGGSSLGGPEAGSAAETLVFVGIRGSYGAEWVSNFNLPDAASPDADHRGFKTAEQEVAQALERYLDEIGADPARTRILITGHSRGGAIANLLAADLVDRADGPQALAAADAVYAYTFAAPCPTKSAERGDSAYAGIFNIVNPSDLVPQLPLPAWGYGRYGTTVELPGYASTRFASSLALMQQAYQANTGLLDSYSPDALERLDSFDAQAAQSLPTVESLLNPFGIFTAVRELLEVDLGLAFTSHCPDTYIAWMQAVDARALTFTQRA